MVAAPLFHTCSSVLSVCIEVFYFLHQHSPTCLWEPGGEPGVRGPLSLMDFKRTLPRD